MNKRWILIVAVATLFCAAVGSAQPAMGTPQQRAGRAAVLAEYLQPTPEQITTWKQLRSDTAAAMKPLAQSAQDLRRQLDAATSAPSPDPATIGKLTLALRSARDQMRSERDASKAKFVATLSPEQKTKFDALQAAGSFLKHRRQGANGMAPR